MKNKNTNSGITLIALIITIIIMLILVAVTITMAVNGGLFNYAQKAVGETKNAIDKEQELGSGGLNIAGTWYNSIDEYINIETITETHNWTRTGDDFKCLHCNAEYTMGEVVNYQRAKAGETVTAILTASKSGLDRFYEDNESNYPEFAIVDDNGNQTIEAQDVNWVVLGIEDTNDDDIYETLLITTETHLWVKDDEENFYGVYFYGASGYNNAASYYDKDGKRVEGEIDRICRELYSNSEYGQARGMTIEDLNSALNYTPTGGEYHDGNQIQLTNGFTTKIKDLPDEIWNSIRTHESGTNTPDGTNTPEALGEYVVNGYSYLVDREDNLKIANNVNNTKSSITEIERDTIFGPLHELYEDGEYVSYFEYGYWLPSRGVFPSERGYVNFGVGAVIDGETSSCGQLLFSSESVGLFNGSAESSAGLRPVVALKSKLPTVK